MLKPLQDSFPQASPNMATYRTVVEKFSTMSIDDHFLSNSQISPLTPYGHGKLDNIRKTSNHIEPSPIPEVK